MEGILKLCALAYTNDKEVRDYVNKYAYKQGILPEKALSHAIVQVYIKNREAETDGRDNMD